MLISGGSIDAFRDIYQHEFVADLTQREVERKARTLLNLYKAVYGSVREQIWDVNTPT